MSTTIKPGSAYDTWKKAGAQFAIESRHSGGSTIQLGEEAQNYAHTRGLPHPDIIARAFREGFYEAYNSGD